MAARAEFLLYDLFESDAVGVFDFFLLLGADPIRGRRAEQLWGAGFGRRTSDAAVLSLRSWLLFRGSQRLADAVDVLRSEGWLLRAVPVDGGPVFVSPEVEFAEEARARLLTALRPHILWAAVKTGVVWLVGVEAAGPWTDLRGASADAPELAPTDAVAVVEELRAGTARAGRVLDLLTSVRDRMIAALDLALGLPGDEAVVALSPQDPAPFRHDPPDDLKALDLARNNRRVRLFHLRARIDDGLLEGEGVLTDFVAWLRAQPLHPQVQSHLDRWADGIDPKGVEQRRVAAMARLVSMPGAGAAILRRALFEGTAPRRGRALGPAGQQLAGAVAEAPLEPIHDALTAPRDGRDLVAFLWRHVTWSRGGERPGLETIGTAVGGAPPGDEAQVDAAARLHRARTSIARWLRDPAHVGGPGAGVSSGVSGVSSGVSGGVSAGASTAAAPASTGASPKSSVAPASTGASPKSAAASGSKDGSAKAPTDSATERRALWPAEWAPLDSLEFERASLRAQTRDALAEHRPWNPLDAVRAGLAWVLPALRSLAGLEFAPRLALAGAVLGEEAPRVGDARTLVLRWDGDADAVGPVIVRSVGDRVEVVHPTNDDSVLPLSAFGAGRFELPVVLAEPPGDHRYLIALAPLAFDWSADDPFAGLREAVATGQVPAVEVELTVR